MIYQHVADFFESNGIAEGFEIQTLRWRDNGDKNTAYIVFKPAGGSAISNDLGADYYVTVDVISGLAEGSITNLENSVKKIIEFIQENPISSDCFSHIENMGGIPAPINTTEGRLVFSLLFNIKN